MKKAIIETGSKQYLVTPGDRLAIDLLPSEAKTMTWQPLLLIDDQKVSIGQPLLKDIDVKAKVLEADVKGDKIISIRFKAKKRVHKRRGHRQRHTIVEISSITKRNETEK